MNQRYIIIHYYVDYSEIVNNYTNQTFCIESYFRPQIMQIIDGHQLPVGKLKVITNLKTRRTHLLGIL